ncbi:GGDEF domain-containing protein [Marinobacterium arenosum]|uniref:GGDEF domain-containing protein n=1 Tax=Marinobacterium arenosum TaxID=2862496 RepID=UPI001C93F71C|nr:GGDEF domain-containing protein [Marinobacterium arenosum]MBY4677787.1 GGDEF domain-containing protein [Marinobacterium arenosum]
MAFRIFRLLFPVVLLLGGATVALNSVNDLSAEYQTVLTLVPYLLALVAVPLGYSFNRSRVVLGALNLCAAYWLIQTGLQTSLDQPHTFVLFSLLAIVLPLNTGLIALYQERGLLTPLGAVRLAVVVLSYSLLYLLWQNQQLGYFLPELPMLMLEMLLHNHYMSQASAIAFLVAALPVIASLAFRRTHTDGALLASLLAAGILLIWFDQPLISALFVSAALITLCTSVVQNSHSMAFLDELTGIPARRALMDKLSTLGRRYTIAMMDVDHFKKFNDTYGHDIGDQVLRMVASQIRRVGGGGKAFRYGGEEFTVVFAGKTEEEALVYLEEVRERIANYPMHIRSQQRPQNNETGRQLRNMGDKSEVVSVTISIGLCEKDSEHADAMAVIKAADQALYAAKNHGRNCSVAAHNPPARKQRRSRTDFAN